MKKVLAILLVLTMVFAFAACGGKEEPTAPAADEAAATQANDAEVPSENAEVPTEAEETTEEPTTEEPTTEEPTTEAGLNTEDLEAVVAFYNDAVHKTNEKGEIKGSNRMSLDGDITADGGLGGVLKVIMPVIEKTLAKNSGTQTCIPGQGKLEASDIKSFTCTQEDGKTKIYFEIKSQTDGPDADADTSGSVSRAISTLGSIERAINELGAEIKSGRDTYKLTYDHAYIKATINEDGIITSGNWHYKVNINVGDTKIQLVIPIKAKNLHGIIDWNIEY